MLEKTKGPTFRKGQVVVYPGHGLGMIEAIEKEAYAGIATELYVLKLLEDESGRLRIPKAKALQNGMRPLVSKDELPALYKLLQSKPKTTSGMWKDRALKQQKKLDTGDFTKTAEVIRDLYREKPDEAPYSERGLYEPALERLVLEVAHILGVEVQKAVTILNEKTGKSFSYTPGDVSIFSKGQRAFVPRRY